MQRTGLGQFSIQFSVQIQICPSLTFPLLPLLTSKLSHSGTNSCGSYADCLLESPEHLLKHTDTWNTQEVLTFEYLAELLLSPIICEAIPSHGLGGNSKLGLVDKEVKYPETRYLLTTAGRDP